MTRGVCRTDGTRPWITRRRRRSLCSAYCRRGLSGRASRRLGAIGHAVAITVAVDAIRHAVAIAIAGRVHAAAVVAVVRPALAIPAALLEHPASVTLFPARGMPVHAGPFLHPVALGPDMAAIAPVPIPFLPDVAGTMRRNHFMARRRRRHVDIDLRGGRHRNQSDGRRGERREQQFAFPHVRFSTWRGHPTKLTPRSFAEMPDSCPFPRKRRPTKRVVSGRHSRHG
jgi:hypothetical protein